MNVGFVVKIVVIILFIFFVLFVSSLCWSYLGLELEKGTIVRDEGFIRTTVSHILHSAFAESSGVSVSVGWIRPAPRMLVGKGQTKFQRPFFSLRLLACY